MFDTISPMGVMVEIESSLGTLLASNERDVPAKAREYIVLELYREGKLSSGKAAELLDMERTAFVEYASSLGIPYAEETASELDSDLVSLRAKLQPSA